jgi:DNA ligase (NAD+)
MENYRQLIQELNEATKAYDEGRPYMSDHEWDEKYWQLVDMEKKFGIASSDSPTQSISYKLVSNLEKITHGHKMLSLAKSKDPKEILEFIGNQRTVLAMLKMDGLTLSLTYENGKLIRAETRGNGVVGEDVLHNAMVIPSIPKRIRFKGKLVVDGEIICCYDDFSEVGEGYKNPRNFAAGSIRLLDSKDCADRRLTFVAWDVIEWADYSHRTLGESLYFLREQGFITVPYCKIAFDSMAPIEGELYGLREELTEQTFNDLVDTLKKEAEEKAYPIDGLVFKFDNIQYGKELGATDHHFKNAIAFKFYDETYPSILRNIEWTMGRTGALTPVAIFDTIEIDGTEVSRANLFNLDIMHSTLQCNTKLGGTNVVIPQRVYVYKANQIIPQIESSELLDETVETKSLYLPHTCPYCGGDAHVSRDGNSAVLKCRNPACTAKLVNRLDHFCGKKGLDIKGLSIATLDKLIDWGWVNTFADIFKLQKYKEEWKRKPGFGEASVNKILNAIELARTTSTHESFISAIGIPLIGRAMVKELMKNGITTYYALYTLVQQKQDFSQFNGFGYEKSESLLNFDYSEANEAYALMTLVIPDSEEKTERLAGKTVVITGTLKHFKNRTELQQIIEAAGGKVVGSISKNTSYLINNDVNSTSTKNQAAKKLGIPIISEEDFLKII